MDLAELGRLADLLETTRSKRLEADKKAATLKAEENRLKGILITHMEGNDLSSVGGQSCVVNRLTKQRAIACDWNEIHKFIIENDAFDLLQRRLKDSAIKERLDDGVDVPGVSLMDYSHITYSKART